MPIIINIKDKILFSLFIDDYLSSSKTFGDIFKFLYEIYFSHIVFKPVYLTKKKMFTFDNKFDILDFKKLAKN